MTAVTVTLVSKKSDRESVWVVKSAGRPIGLLTKFRNTRLDTHPIKAYAGVGFDARFLAAYYPEYNDAHPSEKVGGRTEAIAAIVQAA